MHNTSVFSSVFDQDALAIFRINGKMIKKFNKYYERSK